MSNVNKYLTALHKYMSSSNVMLNKGYAASSYLKGETDVTSL